MMVVIFSICTTSSRVLGHKNLGDDDRRFYVELVTVDAVRKFSAMALEGDDRGASDDCPFRKFHPAWIRVVGRIIASLRAMFAILHALGMFVADLFKSRVPA